MKYGLTDTAWEKLQNLFALHDKIRQVILYGSRAKGNYKPFSDVDIVLIGDELTQQDLNRIVLEVDDLLLPYQFDIAIFQNLTNPELIDHIRRRGIVIYDKSKT
ncbi:nucleotidyltransferase domain-containing protein [Alistipes sp.]|uniref:nucleotidyltransferase domain-containing protein n=1 Tax=Alistipes sp. TaxID=1872444 RepID=UPI0025B9435D|nr:nucleotidyltransferase domain-containing protein [Alistipes sp.]